MTLKVSTRSRAVKMVFSLNDWEIYFQPWKSKSNMWETDFDQFYNIVFVRFLQGRISAGHDTLPYGLLIRFSTVTSIFKSLSPAKYTPQIDLMTFVYGLKYRNLRVQLYPIRVYNGELREMLVKIFVFLFWIQ